MANISSSFTQLLPTELYVAGISTNITGSYTYNGPETFDVWVERTSGLVSKVDVNSDPPEGGDIRKTINAKDSAQLPYAYTLSHQFADSYTYNYTYTDVTMGNGDVYKKIDNPDLRDAYEVQWDFVNGNWKFKQIIKLLRNDSADIAKGRRDYVKTYSDQYDFGDTINTKIDHYLAGIGTYLGNNPDYETWKYVTLPASVGTIPKIPVDVQVELNKVSINGVGGVV
tara:strand:- start:4297 stop:4974 length:678 start_codon:yes stop_codon:yes gene_type:complete